MSSYSSGNPVNWERTAARPHDNLIGQGGRRRTSPGAQACARDAPACGCVGLIVNLFVFFDGMQTLMYI